LFFFSSRRRHTRSKRDWSSDVCSSDLHPQILIRLIERQVVNKRQFALDLAFAPRQRGDAVLVIRFDNPLAQERMISRLGAGQERSEERRVGKECRARWGLYHAYETEYD